MTPFAIAFFTVCFLTGSLILLITLRTCIDLKRVHRMEIEQYMMQVQRSTKEKLITEELKTPVGKRDLCRDCKLHKWFIINPTNDVVQLKLKN